MNGQAINKLVSIRQSYERLRPFPETYCRTCSMDIALKLDFTMVFGAFVDTKEEPHGHYWTVTEDNEIVDLTAGQFGRFPKYFILNIESEEAKRHYIEISRGRRSQADFKASIEDRKKFFELFWNIYLENSLWRC